MNLAHLHVEINADLCFGRNIPMAIWWTEPSRPELCFALTGEAKAIKEFEPLPHFNEFRSLDEVKMFLLPFVRLAESLGMGNEKASTLQGELKATKYHLEDLRILAKVNRTDR